MIIYLFIFLVVVVTVPAAYAADEYVIAGGEKGIRLVPVFYVDTVYCKDYSFHDVGCYDPNADYITIKTGYRDQWTPRGCTVLQHEQGHAWGLHDEVSVGTFADCDNPNDHSATSGQYDPNNFFHGNPHYIWQGYHKTPLNIKLYGEPLT